jgi:hypothetical protein
VRPRHLDHQLLLDAALLDPAAGGAAAFARWRGAVDIDHLDGGSFRLLPLVVANLGEHVDGEVAGRVQGVARYAWAWTQRLLGAAEPVLADLDEAGIPALLTKGSALVVGYGTPAKLRPMHDLDIAVPHARFDEAVEICRRHALEPEVDADHPIWRDAHAVSLANPAGVRLDLHRFVLASWPRPGADDPIWETAAPAAVRSAPCAVPGPAELLLGILEHAARWNPQDTNIRWAADAVTLLRSNAVDWDRFAWLADHYRLTATTSPALTWLRDRYGAPVPPSVLVAPRPTPGGLVDRAWGRPDPERRSWERAAVAVRTELRALRGPGEALRPAHLVEAARRAAGVERARSLVAEAAFVAAGRPAALRPARRRWRPDADGVERIEIRAAVETTRDSRGTAILGTGWSSPEEAGVWTDGPEAELHFAIGRDLVGLPVVVELLVDPHLPPGAELRRVDVHADGRRVRRLVFAGIAAGMRPVTIRLVPRRPEIDLALVVRHPHRPHDIGASHDTRRLGLLLRSVTVRPAVAAAG